MEKASPDVVLLHPDFADISPVIFIREFRRWSTVPLVILGDLADEMEMATSLETGANDYVRLPFNPTELVTRTWALLRRTNWDWHYDVAFSQPFSWLCVILSKSKVFLNGKWMPTTPAEFRLLRLLVHNYGISVPFQTLGRAGGVGELDRSALVQKCVQRLRNKLGDDARKARWIKSVGGLGYRLIGPAFEVEGLTDLRTSESLFGGSPGS